MFGTFVIELVIGMCFLFAMLGIVTTAITEGLMSALKVRSRHCAEWLADLLDALHAQPPGSVATAASRPDGPADITAVTAHPLLATQTTRALRGGGRVSSYVDTADLAAILLRDAGLPLAERCIGQPLSAAHEALRTHLRTIEGQPMARVLDPLLTTAAARAADGSALVRGLHAEVTRWLDASMGRTEGRTRRTAKILSLTVAAVVCLVFNVDALQVMRTLSNDPQLRSAVATAAIDAARQEPGCQAMLPGASGASTPSGSHGDARDCVQALRQAESTGMLSRLGIGWDTPPGFVAATGWVQGGLFLVWLAGVAIATFASSLGGDFWFRWIGDIVRLTGFRPAARGPDAGGDAPSASPSGTAPADGGGR